MIKLSVKKIPFNKNFQKITNLLKAKNHKLTFNFLISSALANDS